MILTSNQRIRRLLSRLIEKANSQDLKMKFKALLLTGLSLLAHHTLLAQPATQQSPLRDGYFALNGSKMFHIPDQIDGVVQDRLEWMKELDVHWDRIDLWWHVVEPEKGTWDFTRPDRVFDEFEEHNIQWYPILCYGAAWWQEEGRTAPVSDQDYEDFGEYVFRVIERYGDRATYWSVWNEPNITTFWSPSPDAASYARLLKITAERARAANPEVRLGAPAMAPLGRWDREFTEKLYSEGAKDNFDFFDYHYYRSHPSEEEVIREIGEIRAVMHRYEDRKPIWITESGVSAHTKDKEESYRRQASLVPRNQLLCFALGIERFFYFDLQNWDDDPDSSWDSKLGLVEAGGKPKPAFYAYKKMVEEIEGTEPVGILRSLGENTYGVLYYNPKFNGYSIAAWNTEWGEVTRAQIHHDPQKSGTGTDRQEYLITNFPRYIHGVSPVHYMAEAGVQFERPLTILSPGESTNLKVGSPVGLATPWIEFTKLTTSDGITWDDASEKVVIAKDCGSGLHRIELEGRAAFFAGTMSHRSNFKITTEIEVRPALEVMFRPYMENDKLLADYTVRNLSSFQYSAPLQLNLVDPGSKETLYETDEKELGEGATINETINLKEADFFPPEGPVTHWRPAFGENDGRQIGIYTLKKASDSITIDGSLDEWGDAASLDINSENQITRNQDGWTKEDIYAQVSFAYDKENIYVAGRIYDDQGPHNPNPPNELWKGDALEVYLGLRGPSRLKVIDKKQDFQIGLAPTTESGEGVVFLFHEDVILDDGKVAYTKTESGYNLEARIPIQSLIEDDQFTLEPGQVIGLDVQVDDLDDGDIAPEGNTPGHAMAWNGTARNWIDPSNWGIGYLDE